MAEGSNKVQLRIVVERDIADKLVELAGSPRKQGDLVSQLIMSAWEQRQSQSQPVDLAVLQQQLRDLQDQVSRAINQQSAVSTGKQ